MIANQQTEVRTLELSCRLISLRAMGPAPSRLLVESLLVTLNAVPAEIVRPVVRAEGLDDVSGFAIATFAAMHYEMFDAH